MNLAERIQFPGSGPIGGVIVSAAMGTAAVFSAGLTPTYSGFGIYNPLTTSTQGAVKIVPIEATITPTGVSTANNYFALAKFNCSTGTCTGFTAGTFSGTMWQAGVPSIAVVANNYGTSTNVRAIPFGTGSMMSAPAYCKMLGNLLAGTGTIGPATGPVAGFSGATYPLQGDITLMPGEGICFVQGIAGTAIASLSWVEVSV